VKLGYKPHARAETSPKGAGTAEPGDHTAHMP